MKVLVTGSEGFIGKNLIVYLNEIEDVEILKYDINNSLDELKNMIHEADIIYHLAGVNRPTNVEDFYSGNFDLSKIIVEELERLEKKIPLIFTSSIQAELDNDYGKSKKMAEEVISNYSNSYIYRLHNVFGKWCKPNYNSVVATFCYNISHDLPIQINDPSHELNLIYIDDICESLIKIIGENFQQKKEEYYYISPIKKINLQELADLIYSFKNDMESIYVPKTGDEFIKKLFATYVSYLPLEKMAISAEKHVDDRGSFTELVRTMDSGQFSISFSKPGIVRGNHYHNTKMERFIVVKGTAKIKLKKVNDEEYGEFIVNDDDIKVITIPVGYTHSIENIGEDEMILIMWCNELFNTKHPDTYFMEVKNEERLHNISR